MSEKITIKNVREMFASNMVKELNTTKNIKVSVKEMQVYDKQRTKRYG